MKSLWQPPTLHRNLPAPVDLVTPLKPHKNHFFLVHLRASSTDYIPKKCDLTATRRRSPPPANWGMNIVGPNRAFIVERDGKYLKTLTTGIHFLNPMVDKIVDAHSLKEHVIKIPLDTVISGDTEIVVEGNLSIKIVDPYLATYGNADLDSISAVTHLVKTTLPLRTMLEKSILNPKFDEVFKIFDNIVSYFHDFDLDDVDKFDIDIPMEDREKLKGLMSFVDELDKPEEIGKDDGINEIAAAWGVRCLRYGISYDLPKVELSWGDKLLLVEVFVFKSWVLGNKQKMKRLLEVFKRLLDKAMKALEILRHYYKSSSNSNNRGGDNGAVDGGKEEEV